MNKTEAQSNAIDKAQKREMAKRARATAASKKINDFYSRKGGRGNDEVSVTQGNKRITGSAARKVADNYPL